MQDDHGDEDLYRDLERRALFDMPAEVPGEDAPPDLVDVLRGDGGGQDPARDMSLGGYIEEHDRVPAFEGSDGQPYTVDIDVEEIDGDGSFAAFLVFIRWAATGAGIMDHAESGDVARGLTEDEARRAALDLSLYEIRAELDAAIERRRRALEE
jgi:hypothetical protein